MSQLVYISFLLGGEINRLVNLCTILRQLQECMEHQIPAVMTHHWNVWSRCAK